MKVIFSALIAAISLSAAISSSAATIHSLRGGYSPFAFDVKSDDVKSKVKNSASSEVAIAYLEKEADEAQLSFVEPAVETLGSDSETASVVETLETAPVVETSESSSVSEPGTIALSLLGAIMLLGFRNKKMLS